MGEWNKYNCNNVSHRTTGDFYFLLYTFPYLLNHFQWVKRKEVYKEKKRKKTLQPLIKHFTTQDGKIPRIYKPFLPSLTLADPSASKLRTVFLRNHRIKWALTGAFIKSLQLPSSCRFFSSSSSSGFLPPSYLGCCFLRLAAFGQCLKLFFHK